MWAWRTETASGRPCIESCFVSYHRVVSCCVLSLPRHCSGVLSIDRSINRSFCILAVDRGQRAGNEIDAMGLVHGGERGRTFPQII